MPDSAPENTIVRPERAIFSHVASLYCISDVDAAERPPAQAEAGDPLGELRGARLADEEVHVVHLHGVDAVGASTRCRITRSMRAGDCASQRRFDIATTAQKLQANGQPNDELCATVRSPR